MITTCRLCACDIQDSKTVSIFSFNQNRLILDLISIFCPIRIERADNLPQKICNSCLKLILDANELREKSVRSDYKLRQASFSEINPYDSPNVDFQAEIGSEQLQDTEMVTVKQENPLETHFLIKEVTSVVEQEESTNLSFLDEYCDDDDDEEQKQEKNESGSDVSRSINRMFQGKKTSKYKLVNGRYKCPLCEKTYTLTNAVAFHIRHAHTKEVVEYKRKYKKGSVQCLYCEEKLSSLSNRNRHIKRKHEEKLEGNYTRFKDVPSAKFRELSQLLPTTSTSTDLLSALKCKQKDEREKQKD